MDIDKRRQRESGRDYALRVLKENIVNLELKPGLMVSEKELANKMEISRTPLREALMELVKVKIVEVYPQRGCKIALIDYGIIEEIRNIRSLMECEVVELASQMATENDIIDLQENVLLQDFYLKTPEKLMQLDNEFHTKLFIIAKKMLMHQMLESYSVHFDRVRRMALYAVKEVKVVRDHKDIVTALSEHNGEQAKKRMLKHLSQYKIDEEGIRSIYPKEYFI